jgi:hypothetical protein
MLIIGTKSKDKKRTHSKLRNKQTTKRLKKFDNDILIRMVAIRITRKALYDIMNTIGTRSAETGGILLGPIGTNYVTHFYFDRGGACTGSTYSPDYLTLSRKMREEWLPAGLDMRGFAHSHGSSMDRLSAGDMKYIRRLMDKNTDMDMFIAPIVLPNQYAIRPLVVSRNNMDRAQQAYFEIID